MDDVTKAALEIAVEQLEAAEQIIQALTEENERLKAGQLTWGTSTGPWASAYPRQTTTWNSVGNATATHVALYSTTAAASNASSALVNLSAQTKQFSQSMEKLRKRYEETYYANDAKVDEA